jgi:hypothetical protein
MTSDPDEAVLMAVARLMHHWSPSDAASDPESGISGFDITGLENP